MLYPIRLPKFSNFFNHRSSRHKTPQRTWIRTHVLLNVKRLCYQFSNDDNLRLNSLNSNSLTTSSRIPKKSAQNLTDNLKPLKDLIITVFKNIFYHFVNCVKVMICYEQILNKPTKELGTFSIIFRIFKT